MSRSNTQLLTCDGITQKYPKCGDVLWDFSAQHIALPKLWIITLKWCTLKIGTAKRKMV